jgi:hypothetical protein
VKRTKRKLANNKMSLHNLIRKRRIKRRKIKNQSNKQLKIRKSQNLHSKNRRISLSNNNLNKMKIQHFLILSSSKPKRNLKESMDMGISTRIQY